MNIILHIHFILSDWDCCCSCFGSAHDLHHVWLVVQEQEVRH